MVTRNRGDNRQGIKATAGAAMKRMDRLYALSSECEGGEREYECCVVDKESS